jgi:hypothetical protein
MTALTLSFSAALTTRPTSSAADSLLPIWMPLLVASKASLLMVQEIPAAANILARLSMYYGKLTTSIEENSVI